MGTAGTLALRTYAIRSNDFKRDLAKRRVPSELVRAYRLARFSRLVWVVEIIDRSLRAAGSDCVIGEAVFDGTSSVFSPTPVVLHVPGIAILFRTDGTTLPVATTGQPYGTGGIGPA